MQGVEFYGGVEAVAKGGDDAAAEKRADVVGNVLGRDDEGDEEGAEGDGDGCEPAVTRAVWAAGLFAEGRAGFVQCACSRVGFDAVNCGKVTFWVALTGRESRGLKPGS